MEKAMKKSSVSSPSEKSESSSSSETKFSSDFFKALTKPDPKEKKAEKNSLNNLSTQDKISYLKNKALAANAQMHQSRKNLEKLHKQIEDQKTSSKKREFKVKQADPSELKKSKSSPRPGQK